MSEARYRSALPPLRLSIEFDLDEAGEGVGTPPIELNPFNPRLSDSFRVMLYIDKHCYRQYGDNIVDRSTFYERFPYSRTGEVC